MLSMRRRTIGQALVTASALVAGMLATLTPATAAEQPSPPSAQEYLSWLAEQDDPGAARTATEFTALSEADQEKFLAYLVDKEAMAALAQAATGDLDGDPADETGGPVERKRAVLAGGDIEVTSEQGVKPESPDGQASTLAAAQDWSCWYNAKQKVLGVTITSLNFKQWYHSTGTKVDKVYNASASHTNYNVGVSISHEPEEQWISGAGNALAYVTWHGNIIYKGFGVSLDKRHHLRCDETGLRYHYLKNV
ncbi:hypothetical protein ACFY9Y_00505 [Streptomyces fimicarius]|uniref:hypothetical protein n=2 Tax=Streptomyces griseus TaxID=1911 RepID=UPI0036E4D770